MTYKKIYQYFLVFLILSCTACNTTSDENSSSINDNKLSNVKNEIKEDISNTKVTYFLMDAEHPFNQNGYWMKIVGLKEYSSIKNENYIDIPKEGNIFLVLFLELKNNTPQQDYIAHENIIAIIDDSEIESTFLINNPEGYSTIKNIIASNETKYGFLVWEVPKNWSKAEISYTGWENSLHVIPVITLTPENLFDPIPYEEIDWYE